ncbi:hypothetical protein RBB84_19095 [Rhodococcus sp. D-6]|uniref:Uncharacterized protein n=1 Tax=Rhodococcus sp. D-6 TaxID=1387842 RepID=A0AAU7UVB9_9NOCA
MKDTSLLITATIAMHPSACDNTIDLTAVDADSHPNDPPAWEQEIPVGDHPTPAWGQQLADDVLATNGYRRDGQWWCSTDLTGYPSSTADVVHE